MNTPTPLRKIIDATGLSFAKFTFVKIDKVMFTIDTTKDGSYRVIYSQGFLDAIGCLDRYTHDCDGNMVPIEQRLTKQGVRE